MEAALAYFRVLSQSSPAGTTENREQFRRPERNNSSAFVQPFPLRLIISKTVALTEKPNKTSRFIVLRNFFQI
jgi:hypothetical protein